MMDDVAIELRKVGQTIEQKLNNAKAGWQDSNAQHAITQLSLSEIRTEMNDRIAALYKHIDERFDEVMKALRKK